MKKLFFLCLLSLVYFSKIKAQDTSTIHRKRLKLLIVGGSTAYAASMTGLYFLWYDKDTQTSFHFFNDNPQWKQVDKIGHFYSAFHIARSSAELFKWSGLKKRKAIFWGSITGIILMTPIEFFDGFSEKYGASWGDFVANTSGSLLLYGQHLLWDEVRVHPKLSFKRTSFAPQRPNILGDGWTQEWLKDYNGQTYWFSFDVDKFLPKESKFPKWLNIAIGYGAENMLYARDKQNLAVNLKPYRQYYIGIDFDLSSIKTKKKWLKPLLFIVNMVHIPAPALEYNSPNGFNFHWLKF